MKMSMVRPLYDKWLMVGFIQKMLVKVSIITEYDQNIVPELLFPVNGMNDCDKMLFFHFSALVLLIDFSASKKKH